MLRNGKSISLPYSIGKYFDYYLPGAHHIAKCSEYKLNVLMICDLINNY